MSVASKLFDLEARVKVVASKILQSDDPPNCDAKVLARLALNLIDPELIKDKYQNRGDLSPWHRPKTQGGIE